MCTHPTDLFQPQLTFEARWIPDLHDLPQDTIPGLDLDDSDPAQHLVTAGWDLNDILIDI